MKPRCSHQRNHGWTLIELLVVIGVVAIFLALIDFGPPPSAKRKAQRIQCVNNLKQIVLATKIWSGDSTARYPMEVSVARGGTLGLNTNGDNAWLNFLVMSNELSVPKILLCPSDINRFPPATNFSSELKNKISYFIGLDATDEYPQRFFYGDDNFEIGGIPVKSGLLEILTNEPIAWTSARHKTIGNIALVDGSVQTLSNSNLLNRLHQTGLATNRLAIP